MSCRAPITELFSAGELSDREREGYMMMMDDLRIDAKSDVGKSSVFTGEEELFAFERVVSRLTEMQTQDYWNARDIGASGDNQLEGWSS